MKREWKPGDVAVYSCPQDDDCSTPEHPAILGARGMWWFLDRGEYANDGGPIRPLVVIDPEDREQVERLAKALRDGDRNLSATSIPAVQAALREFANPTPPKPDEPTGLGAVVEDERKSLWFRMAVENQTWPGEVWQEQYGTADRWSKWDAVAAVTVLSEGVQP